MKIIFVLLSLLLTGSCVTNNVTIKISTPGAMHELVKANGVEPRVITKIKEVIVKPDYGKCSCGPKPILVPPSKEELRNRYVAEKTMTDYIIVLTAYIDKCIIVTKKCVVIK